MKPRIKKSGRQKRNLGISRKAQIRMAETISVMFVFFILLVLGIVFYSRIQAAGMKEESEERFVQKAIGISQIIAFLPEAQCSQENVVTDNCFDYLKLQGFNTVVAMSTDNQLYYYDHFGFANITIEIVEGSGEDIVLYDNPKPGWTRIINTPTPISIYNPIARTHSLGVLMIRVYQ